VAIKKDIADQLAESCRILGTWDMTHGAEGHVSYWDGEAPSIHIRGKGYDQLGVRYTRSSDIVEVDFEANTIAGGSEGVRSPSEAFLHTWLFQKNPELRSVVHMHPRHAMLLTICEKAILPIHGRAHQGAKLAADGIDTYQTSITIHDHEKGERFADFMGKKRVALMRGHGITVVGTSIEDATVRALELNELLKLTYEAYLLGDPKPLPQGDIDYLRKELDPNRPRGAAGGERGMLANYAYYAMVAGEREVPTD
jgi:ribulose-5-phosphate 4-epimerase/fuculose-1-phosphate aldolase